MQWNCLVVTIRYNRFDDDDDAIRLFENFTIESFVSQSLDQFLPSGAMTDDIISNGPIFVDRISADKSNNLDQTLIIIIEW